jgi:DNA-binding response OmpR family regulator
MSSGYQVVFIDNSLHKIFRTIDLLQKTISDVKIFPHEDELFIYLENYNPDIILISLELSPNDGMILLKELRQKPFRLTPFIVLYSEKQDDYIQELAFNSGADAFVGFHQKPVIMGHFLTNMLKRRSGGNTTLKKSLVVDNDRYLVFKNGEPIQLPRKEFRLFQYLFDNPEKFHTKDEIAQMVWQDLSIAKKRNIDVHIYNIRQHFGKRIIQSQKGKGYRINKKLLG